MSPCRTGLAVIALSGSVTWAAYLAASSGGVPVELHVFRSCAIAIADLAAALQ